LKLWLARDSIAIDLIAPSDHTMERLLMMPQQQILPHGIVARLIVSLEIVRVDTGAES
jgi:hypothetical protein